MKKLLLILATSIAVSVVADDDREEKRDQPRRGDAPSFRLPPKPDGESEEARKKRLLELLKKRRGQAAEAPARRGSDREHDEARGRGRGPRESDAREVRRGREHHGDEHAERDHDAPRHNALEEIEQRIIAAKRAGRHEEAEKLTHQLRKMQEHRARDEHAHRDREHAAHAERGRRPEAVSVEEAERRMHHLREAAELLGAVGKHDEAQKLAREAHAIEEKLEQHHRGRGHHEGPSNAQLAEAIERMQRQIRELHQAINAINSHLKRNH